jgi:hypothetical protein
MPEQESYPQTNTQKTHQALIRAQDIMLYLIWGEAMQKKNTKTGEA